MSGMSTNQKHAILDTTHGMRLGMFRNATELAEQAIRNAWGEFKTPEEHVAWAEHQAELLRDHHELPATATDPMALLCRALRLAQRMPGTDGDDVRHTLRLLAQHLRRAAPQYMRGPRGVCVQVVGIDTGEE